ncbi:SDR family NAD(P)-dependent oxidoreductase [Hoeflea prorocentri]|uniref:SDR family NAD(P)-dependent oxidoreductase n=1 Tax=Hoeflea prorocentri TaxID=1922333 RepID=A0A9X3UN45_9HYPH|nr:SDR family oxidoreductase [Hoeflea prorocentri]MCY6382264.1 SDR family NAD(P)-dependent oxidoreductase [Hoeflea prorocentri]MDA5400064.1 SDR family NAD(P)-dependent oxidoreductase [Hoeflea prorocentri]
MDARPTAIITGATGGIGQALAHRMQSDFRLFVTGRKAAEECRADLPPDASYIRSDLSQPAKAADTIAAALEEAGVKAVTRLVLNAGTGIYASVFDEDGETIRNTLDVNLMAPVLLIHRLAPFLEAGDGKLVLIGSVAHRGSPNMPSYAASKAGLSGLARSLRSEWQDRIAVQIIHPGPTRTSMHEKAGYSPGRLERLFFSAEAMADEIVRLMETEKPSATIMLAARLRRLLTGRVA